MKFRLFTISFILGLSFSSKAQLNENFISFLEQGVESIVNEYDTKGISIAVQSGDNYWSGASGISTDIDSLNTSHVFALGSITKPIVAACILSLMEDDSLSLSDPIHFYLDNIANVDSSVTIKDLLYHTSGIYSYTDHPDFFNTILIQDSLIFSEEEILEKFLLQPSFPLGEKQEYSNTNYLLLGMIIESITKNKYYEEIISRFDFGTNYPSLTIAPHIYDPKSLAHLWFDLGDGKVDLQEFGLSLKNLFGSASAAGAFVGTPTDLAKFGRYLFSGALLDPSSMDSMYNFHPFGLFGEIDYGLGVMQSDTYCNVTSVGHGGAIIYTADLQYVPEYDLSVAVMTNDGGGIPDLGGVAGISQEIICQFEQLTTNVEDIAIDKNDINVFPNPFVDYLKFSYSNELAEQFFVEILDSKGQVISTKQYHEQNINDRILEDRQLQSGLYVVRFIFEDKTILKKAIKMQYQQ